VGVIVILKRGLVGGRRHFSERRKSQAVGRKFANERRKKTDLLESGEGYRPAGASRDGAGKGGIGRIVEHHWGFMAFPSF